MIEAIDSWLGTLGTLGRIPLILVTALSAHLLAVAARRVAAMQSLVPVSPKLRTVATLLTSMLMFSIYFGCFGLILREMGISLTAYLASASVIGLAIGFGSQGVVQDVVTGLTFIFSDLIDVDDMVEVSGQTGIVKGVTMRFVEIETALGARVYIPNRTINSVISYPKGYIRCVVDVRLNGDEAADQAIEETATRLMRSAAEQFPGYMRASPSSVGRQTTTDGTGYLRIKFRIWPGRGGPIETVFAEELRTRLRAVDPAFQAWMVAISYESEARPQTIARRRKKASPRS